MGRHATPSLVLGPQQRGTHNGQQSGNLQGLDQIAQCAGFQGAPDRIVIVVGAQEQERNLGFVAQTRRQFDAVETGHADIQ